MTLPATGPRGEHRRRAARAQAAAARRVRTTAAGRVADVGELERRGTYAGLVTRAIAYALDGAAINVIAFLTAAMIALALSLFPMSARATATLEIIGAGAYLLFVVTYFVAFWTTTGQTPGARAMRIRVVDRAGRPTLRPSRALVRVAGLVLATLPLFAGFLMLLWDDERRALQDRLAGTVVIHAPPEPRVVVRPNPGDDAGRDVVGPPAR